MVKRSRDKYLPANLFFLGGNFVMGETAPTRKFRKPVTRQQALLITNGTTHAEIPRFKARLAYVHPFTDDCT